MLTATAPTPTSAARFVLRGVAGSLALFGLLRLNWVAEHVVQPITGVQAEAAAMIFGAPAMPIAVTNACSGAEAMALCLAAIAAYPVRWQMRLTGALGGVLLLLAVNTLRIGTLARSVALPAWFNTLHLYVWPAILTLAVLAYVLMWMGAADRAAERNAYGRARAQPRLTERLQPSRQFVTLTIVFVVIFIAASPLYLESTAVLGLAALIAQSAALILRIAGTSAHAVANVLWTPSGGVVVTQECISTPLVPLYLAAVCTYSTTWRRMAFGIVATLPIFAALGVARLLVLALPAIVVSPIFWVHTFYQLVLGGVAVYVAAHWRLGRKLAPGHAAAGIIAGALFLLLLGRVYTRLIAQPLAPIDDPQGAIAWLPAFQVGLFLALWVAAGTGAGWRWFAGGLTVLGLSQATGLLALNALVSQAAVTVHVRDVRAWAVAAPVAIFAAVIAIARTRR